MFGDRSHRMRRKAVFVISAFCNIMLCSYCCGICIPSSQLQLFLHSNSQNSLLVAFTASLFTLS